jgi:hypothetical protein
MGAAGIGTDEFDVIQSPYDHVFHGVAAASSHTDHLDDSAVLRGLVDDFKHGLAPFPVPVPVEVCLRSSDDVLLVFLSPSKLLLL